MHKSFDLLRALNVKLYSFLICLASLKYIMNLFIRSCDLRDSPSLPLPNFVRIVAKVRLHAQEILGTQANPFQCGL